jgi:hypothetical protein
MEVTLMPFGSLLAALEGIRDPRRPPGLFSSAVQTPGIAQSES